MNCEKAKKMLSAYVDGQPKDKQIIEMHLRECEGCRSEFNVYSRQKEYLRQLKAVEPSPYFRANFWRKVRDMEYNAVRNRISEKMIRWMPLPVFCSLIIFIFLIFSVLSPLLYGQNIETNEKIVQLVKKACLTSPRQKIFSPLNFVGFCDDYCKILCEHCRQKAGSDSECERGRCEK